MDIHTLEPSVTVDFAISIQPKLKSRRIASKLLLFTFHVLSLSAPSIFWNKQCMICQFLFVFLKYILGMCLPKDILDIFRTWNALMMEVHEQIQSHISFPLVYLQWPDLLGESFQPCKISRTQHSTECWNIPRMWNEKLCLSESVTTLTEDLKALSCGGCCWTPLSF